MTDNRRAELSAGDLYLTARQLYSRYSVTHMTLYRWLRDERLSFPKPLLINKRRYWKLCELEAWEAKRNSTAAA